MGSTPRRGRSSATGVQDTIASRLLDGLPGLWPILTCLRGQDTKRIGVVALCAVLCAGLVISGVNLPAPASAAETVTATVSPGSQVVAQGDSFTVDFLVDPNGSGVSGGELNIAFDASAMSMDGVVAGGFFGPSPLVGTKEIDNTAGTARYALARQGATTPPTAAGKFATATFTARDQPGTYPIRISSIGLADEAFNDILGIAISNGGVTINPGVGSIEVYSTPAGATFEITGPAEYAGDTSGDPWAVSDAPEGSFTIAWGGMTGYTSPGNQTKHLSPGGTITFVGSYEAVPTLPEEEAPDRPVNRKPANGATGISLRPTLEASAFTDSDGGTHKASRWQVRAQDGDYDIPVWDSGSTSPVASIEVPSGELGHAMTYYWRVRYQDSSDLWSSYSQETSFSTVDPATVAPTVTTGAASGIGATGATLNLNLDSLGSASSVEVSLEWGAAQSYGSTTAPVMMTGAGTSAFDISGLTPETTYHFRARATGSDTVYGGDETFTTLPDWSMPPAVDTQDAGSVTGWSAQLQGELAWLGTARSVTVSFVWGTVQGGPYPNETVGSGLTAVSGFQGVLSELTPRTTYYYRAKGVGEGTAYGVESAFTTAGMEPVVNAMEADSGRPGDVVTVTITGANLEGATVVDFGEMISVEELRVVSDSQVEVRIVIAIEAETGRRTVVVTTPWGSGASPSAFTVSRASRPVQLWVYLVAAAGGVVGLGALTSIGLWLRRRLAKPPLSR